MRLEISLNAVPGPQCLGTGPTRGNYFGHNGGADSPRPHHLSRFDSLLFGCLSDIGFYARCGKLI